MNNVTWCSANKCCCESKCAKAFAFAARANIGGTFNSVADIHDHKKHPISFRFRTGSKLRRLVEHIGVDIEGIADSGGWIDEFLDLESDTVNDVVTPQGQFVIHGHKIKAVGEHPDVGIYFESVQNGQRVKVTGHLAENTSTKIIGIIPTLAPGSYRVIIVSQYSSGNTMLKEHRTITGGFTLSIE